MIESLKISNFAIVKDLEVTFNNGFTVITGETGAGKSIGIDAINLCIGARSDSSVIRTGEEKAEISSVFSINENSNLLEWLQDKSLLSEDNPTEVIIRRIITSDGKSKSYVNGVLVPLSILKGLGEFLINIHSQHETHQIVKQSYQKILLDRYINNKELISKVANSYSNFKLAESNYKEFLEKKDIILNKRKLLEYMLGELNDLDLKDGEYQELEAEFKTLSNVDEIIRDGNLVLDYLSQDNINIESLVSKISNKVSNLASYDSKFDNINIMVDDLYVLVQEINNEVSSVISGYDNNEEVLSEIESRIQRIESLAKKNNIMPESLYDFWQQALKDFSEIENIDNDEEILLSNLNNSKIELLELSKELHNLRKSESKVLGEEITKVMNSLNMHNSKFYIDVKFDENNISSSGADEIVFMLQSNVGQDAQELSKSASGGELSRIALAVQVLTSNNLDTNTLIFDEIDAGISGKTASIVGKILRQLSKKVQVICVTHIPQVASSGNYHYLVEKHIENNMTNTKIHLLDEEQRIVAIAKLLGSEDISKEALDNARNLIETSKI